MRNTSVNLRCFNVRIKELIVGEFFLYFRDWSLILGRGATKWEVGCM